MHISMGGNVAHGGEKDPSLGLGDGLNSLMEQHGLQFCQEKQTAFPALELETGVLRVRITLERAPQGPYECFVWLKAWEAEDNLVPQRHLEAWEIAQGQQAAEVAAWPLNRPHDLLQRLDAVLSYAIEQADKTGETIGGELQASIDTAQHALAAASKVQN
ncbi:hypothetical protein OAO01_06330 [Oligoflexia bacterium]|nr:hypothetical protein [Oligoflexia bacterium]